MKSYFLSVVIPSYNEIANLRKGTLDKVEHYLERKKYNYEVIVVDDGSDDGSLEFVREFVKENPKFRIIENNHTGKAGAVTAGVLQGQGDYILFSDMDQATPIEEVEKLVGALEEGFDIAIGSRSTARKGSPIIRLVISRSTIILRKLFVGMNSITDTQCGFKMFSKKAARDIFMKVREVHNGFKSIHGSSVTAGFDMELLYVGEKLGYRIKEVPVDWLYVETRRVNPVRDSVEGFFDLIRIKRNIILGVYN